MQDAPEMLALCEELGLASINRSPLAMGLLAGRRAAGQPLDAGAIAKGPLTEAQLADVDQLRER